MHLQDRDALLEASSSAAQASSASTIAAAELPISSAAIGDPAGQKAPTQNGTVAALHDSVDSAQSVQSNQEAISSSGSAKEDRSRQLTAQQQQQQQALQAASDFMGPPTSSASDGKEVPSVATPPLPLQQRQQQQQQQQFAGPIQGDFLADLLASSYTRHAPGTGDMRHDTEGWRCLETSFKVQRRARFAPLPCLGPCSAVAGCNCLDTCAEMGALLATWLEHTRRQLSVHIGDRRCSRSSMAVVRPSSRT